MSVLMDALKKVEETKKTKSESATNEELSESSNSVDSDEELHIFEITDNVELKHTLPQLDQISESDIKDFNQELPENFKETDSPETIIDDDNNASLKNESVNESVSQFQNDEAHSSSHNWDDDFLPEFQSTIEQLDSSVPETDKAIEESTDWNKELVLDDFEEDEKLTTENSESRFEFEEDEIKSEPTVAENSPSHFESVNNDTEKDLSAFPFEQHEPWQSQKNAREQDHSAEVKKDVPLSKTKTKEDSFIHQPPQPEDAKRIFAANGSPPTSKKRTLILLGVMSIVAMGVGYLFFMPSLLTESSSQLQIGRWNQRNQQPAEDHNKPPPLLSESSSTTPMPNSSSSSSEKLAEKKMMVAQVHQPSTTETRQSENKKSSTPPVPNKPEPPILNLSVKPKSEVPESLGNSKSEFSDKQIIPKRKPDEPGLLKPRSPSTPKQAQEPPKTQKPQSQNFTSPQSQKPNNSQPQESDLVIIGEPETSPPTDTPGIYVRKNVVNQISQEILTGYNAFQRGDDKTAYQAYQRALQQNDKNRDALLGLGALAMRSGKMRLAQYYYQRVLKLYPQDSYAVVGLTNTLDKRSPESESQLKLLLEQSPQSAYIHFSLGSFYANQGQWAKAQQAYFDAYRYDNTQADYAYNLAVSLDQLNQPGAALTYYQKALQLARHQVVSFSPTAAQQRLQTLLTRTRSSALTNLSTE